MNRRNFGQIFHFSNDFILCTVFKLKLMVNRTSIKNKKNGPKKLDVKKSYMNNGMTDFFSGFYI